MPVIHYRRCGYNRRRFHRDSLVSDENNEAGKLARGLGEKALGPAADEFGKELAPVGKELGVVVAKVSRMLISGLSGSVYGLEQVGGWIKEQVSQRLKDIPEDKIVEPNPRIAVPATQALLYSMNDELIREMFANLLAADMNADKKGQTHPAFVEMIREMTGPDAKMLSVLRLNAQIQFRIRLKSGNQWQELGHDYSFAIDGLQLQQMQKTESNLRRLEIIEARPNEWPLLPNLEAIEVEVRKKYDGIYKSVVQIPKEIREKVYLPGDTLQLEVFKTGLYMTPMGSDFARVCLTK